MSSKNAIVLFSNGVADISRSYTLKPGENKISIPVQKDAIGDLLASMNVTGKDVKVAKPASYLPSNSDDGALDLSEYVDDVWIGLAQKLAGAEVTVSMPAGAIYKGRLVGVQGIPRALSNNTSGDVPYLVLLIDGGAGEPSSAFHKLKLDDVLWMRFTDATVQSEVNKALHRNFQQIKPDSTFVELTLAAKAAGEATVQYTIPSAAFKFSYRLRDEDKGLVFDGFAVVDNDTEEDWNDVQLSVVTGEPISFTTDLAEKKLPKRSNVNVVSDTAQGAVDTGEAYAEAPAGGNAKVVRAMAMMRAPAQGRGALESCGGSVAMDFSAAATIDEAMTKEVGDFSIFTSPLPVSIPSKQSALIPIFSNRLENSGIVLYFKQSNNNTRAFRAARLKNQADYSFNVGPCTVTQEGIFSGQCVVQNTKPGEESLLAFAKETAVKINVENGERSQKLSRLAISDGVLYRTNVITSVTKYLIRNSGEQGYDFVLDHAATLDSSAKVKVTITPLDSNGEPKSLDVTERTTYGPRINFKLSGSQSVAVSVQERLLVSNEVEFRANTWNEFGQFINSNKNLLVDDAKLKLLMDHRKELDTLALSVEKLNTEAKRANGRADSLRKNIQAVQGQSTPETQDWIKKLAGIENRLTAIADDELPQAQQQQQEAINKFNEALANVAYKWDESDQ
jgi:hypothetical protein